MTYRLIYLPLFAFLISFATAEETRNLKILYSMSGQCLRFNSSGMDMVNECTNKLLQAVYSDGLMSFTFVTENGLVVTFGGLNAVEVTGQNKAFQIIDHIILNDQLILTEKGPSSYQAKGACEYENPFGRVAHINCFARLKVGSLTLALSPMVEILCLLSYLIRFGRNKRAHDVVDRVVFE